MLVNDLELLAAMGIQTDVKPLKLRKRGLFRQNVPSATLARRASEGH